MNKSLNKKLVSKNFSSKNEEKNLPELIPELSKRFECGLDVVHTHRTKRMGENIFKMGITSFAYKNINQVADIEVPITPGDFKMFSRRTDDKPLDMKKRDPYMRRLLVWVDFKRSLVLCVRQPKYFAKPQFKVLCKGPILEFVRSKTSFSIFILFFSLLTNFLGLMFLFRLILYIIIINFSVLISRGITTIMITTSTLSSLILMSDIIFSKYVVKHFEHTKNRPLYVVESIYTND